MFKQLLSNKRTVIVSLVVFVFLIVGIVFLLSSNTKKNEGMNSDIKTEQGKADKKDQDNQNDKADKKDQDNQNDKTDFNDKEDVKENESSKLEIVEPDEVSPEDSSDVSGSWGTETDSDTQTDNSNNMDEEQQTENKNSNEEQKDEGILKDDVTWGTIY